MVELLALARPSSWMRKRKLGSEQERDLAALEKPAPA